MRGERCAASNSHPFYGRERMHRQTGGMEGASDPEHQLSFTHNLPLTQAAVEFARKEHAGQIRQADRAPFIIHPLEAAAILERSRYPDQVVAAAVLHDVLEDTDAERADLEERFGPEVAALVSLVSDDLSILDEDERREDVRERVRRAGGYAPAVYAADKVSKVRELRLMLAGGAEAEEVARKLRHYEKCLAMLEEVIPGSRVVELLRFEIEAFEELPPRPD
jgi:(p)ppGpp synthase/HD superfamily hydrolase